MSLHLVKLCVGCDTVEELDAWIQYRLAEQQRASKAPEHVHTTRMVPKQAAKLVDGGSLYWVIKGSVQVRQRLLEIRPFRDNDGIQRCHLVLEPQLIATEWQPRRAFQGWRYLRAVDAPRDLGAARAGLRELPVEMRRELAELGLL